MDKSFKDPDTLTLTKEQIKQKINNIRKNIENSKQGKIKATQFKIAFGLLNWVIDHYDSEVLNSIFLGLVKEFDDLRYDNALHGNIDDNKILKQLNDIKKNKVK